jgi:dihydrofolate reductase
LIRGYIASTLDGFIAAPDHSFSFLDPYSLEDTDYADFYAEIGTLVMGRLTYEACRGIDPWPYAGKRCIVVTSRPVDDLPERAEVWASGLDQLIEHLRTVEQDVWVVGGGRLQQAFLDRDAIDRLDQFIVPVILGAGILLYPGSEHLQTLKLASVGRFGEIAHLRLERQT